MSSRDKKSLAFILWQIERGFEVCCDQGDYCIEIPKTTARGMIRRLRTLLKRKS